MKTQTSPYNQLVGLGSFAVSIGLYANIKVSNKWDKEKSLYHSFGEHRSSFGFLTYAQAKERKDVLSK